VILPDSTSNVHLSTAVRPPKCLVRFLTSSNASIDFSTSASYHSGLG
jgi:hypothetical protein